MMSCSISPFSREPTRPKSAEVKTFQEANCLGCGNADADLVRTGELCCTYTYNRKIKDGICQNSPNKDRLKKPPRLQRR